MVQQGAVMLRKCLFKIYGIALQRAVLQGCVHGVGLLANFATWYRRRWKASRSTHGPAGS